MMNIQVSVVVATYRRDAALAQALESLAAQTHTATEILLVDDNDHPEWNQKVEGIVDAFRAAHPTTDLTVIVNHPNQGSAKTRNIGIAAAAGEYVTFLDDDDVYLPEKIETQLAAMVAADADYGVTDLWLYNEQEQLVERRTRSYITATDTASLTAYHIKHHITGTDTMMFRRSYLTGIGGFDAIDVGDEFYLMQKAIAGGGVFCYAPVCHVKAYVHTGEDGGLSSGQQKIDGENRLYAYKLQWLPQGDKKTRRYVKMRHHAVLAFAGLRMRKWLYAVRHGLISLLASPIDCVKLIVERKI